MDGENLVIVRARDERLRAFHNVCRHRGTAVVEEPCGKVVRFQCPYHAWIYDLDGSLIRAKPTEDLDDFSFDAFGLAVVRLETWQGFVFVNLAATGPSLSAPSLRPAGRPPRCQADRPTGRVRAAIRARAPVQSTSSGRPG